MRKIGAVALLPFMLVGLLLMVVGGFVTGLWTCATFTKAERQALGVKFALEQALRAVPLAVRQSE